MKSFIKRSEANLRAAEILYSIAKLKCESPDCENELNKQYDALSLSREDVALFQVLLFILIINSGSTMTQSLEHIPILFFDGMSKDHSK